MTEEKKIKIGKIFNKITTVLFVLFFISVFVIPIMNKTFFLVSTIVIAVLFCISCIISHICLKRLQTTIREKEYIYYGEQQRNNLCTGGVAT